jgi:hypothetical protein
MTKVVEFGGPVYCLAWDSKQRQLIAGGRGAIQLLKVLRSSTNYMQTNSEKSIIGYVRRTQFLFKYVVNYIMLDWIRNPLQLQTERFVFQS